MATAPSYPGARPGTPAWVKWLLGCTIGCFALVLACCAGTCLVGKTAFGDLVGKFQTAEREKGLARVASERVAALDLDFPPAIPEDVAEAQLTDEDVQRYLRVRRALQPQAEAFQRIVDGAAPEAGGALGVARGVLGTLGAALDAGTARRVLLEAAEPALRAERMGPTDLARMAEIVEWRFLRRPAALFLGLPGRQGRECLQLQFEERLLAAWTQGQMPPGLRINDRSREDARRDLEHAREKLRSMEAVAAQRTALSGATLAALQARRAELEQVPADGLQALAPLTAEPPLVGFVDHGGGLHVESSRTWSTDETESQPAQEPAQPTDAAPEETP